MKLEIRRGEDHKGTNLTEADVRTIRAERRNGTPLKVLSERYGIHVSAVSNIARRVNWAWLQDEDQLEDT